MANASSVKLVGECLLGETGGEARVHVQVLVVVDGGHPDIGATAGASALDGVAVLQLGGELGGVWRPRAIDILLGGVGIADGSAARNVTNLELDIGESVCPRSLHGRLCVGLHRRDGLRLLGVGGDGVTSLELLGELGLVDSDDTVAAVSTSPGLTKVWGSDVTSTLEAKVSVHDCDLVGGVDRGDVLILPSHIHEPADLNAILLVPVVSGARDRCVPGLGDITLGTLVGNRGEALA